MNRLPRRTRALACASVLVLLPPTAFAKDPANDSQTVPVDPYEQSLAGEAASAAATRTFVIPVSGLTKKNQERAVEELHALGTTANLAISRVNPSVDAKTITLIFGSGGELILSEVEGTLELADVRVDRDALEVPTGAQLILGGDASAEATARLQKALGKSGLFQSFTLRQDEALGELTVVPVLQKVTRYGELSKAVIKLKTGHSLTDFVWAATPVSKA